jgi:hypothetical protein
MTVVGFVNEKKAGLSRLGKARERVPKPNGAEPDYEKHIPISNHTIPRRAGGDRSSLFANGELAGLVLGALWTNNFLGISSKLTE